ncbi:MAG TPA: hypothetical protein VK665_07980 [Candidatus Elarobacter sp.]|nr:hypothetical protein [Candidatus Elarobacter sp.]
MIRRAAGDLREVAVLLDRAVHLTFTRLTVMVTPFLVAAIVSNLMQWPLDFLSALIVVASVGAVIGNRAWVVVVASLQAGRRRPDWSAALRYWPALWYALVTPVWIVATYGALLVAEYGALVVAAAFVALVRRIPAPAIFGPLPLTAALAILAVVSVVLLALMLAGFAGSIASIDTVLEGCAPRRAVARWLREIFRPAMLSRSISAALVILIVGGVAPLLCSYVFMWLPRPLIALVTAVPYALANALSLAFVMERRAAVLAERYGADIAASLAGQTPISASPTASSPGVTTSQ